MSEQDISGPQPGYAVLNQLVDVLKVNPRPFDASDEQRIERAERHRQLKETQQKKYRALEGIGAADGTLIGKGCHFNSIQLGGHPNCEILAQRGYVSILSDEEVRKKIEAATSEFIIAPGKSVIAKRPHGVLGPLDAAKPEHFSTPCEPEHSYVDPSSGRVRFVAATAGDDGMEALQNLIDKGYAIKNPSYEPPKSKRASKS